MRLKPLGSSPIAPLAALRQARRLDLDEAEVAAGERRHVDVEIGDLIE